MTQEEQAALLAQAKAQGVSVDALLRKAVQHIISVTSKINTQQVSADQWQKEFEEWLDSLPNIPTLSDEAISRDSIYTREDEWR
jgi:hypothetical protein